MKPTEPKATRSAAADPNTFALRTDLADDESLVHALGKKGYRCDTDKRGFATPHGRSPIAIRVDSTEGFIPLWAKDMTLRWRFRERSLRMYQHPELVKQTVEGLLGEALLQWGDAQPIKFSKNDDSWDFEIVMRHADDCDATGCVLAAAFFPGAGQQKVDIYPKMFTQSREEQVETLIHEMGHVFGLRHFFANLSETEWPSEVFGKDDPFSIMNYGNLSRLTDADREDLKRLYEMAWSGELKNINGTPIRFVEPHHRAGQPADRAVISRVQTMLQPEPQVSKPPTRARLYQTFVRENR